MTDNTATEASALKQHLAKLLSELAGPITARWAELVRETLPVKPAFEDVPQDTGEPRCAVLVALLDALRDGEAASLPQYLYSLIQRWHAAGLLGEATGPYFSALHLSNESGGAVEPTDPTKNPEWTFNWVGIGFRKSDTDFLAAFNKALKAYMGSDAMMKDVAQYGYGKSQLPGQVTTDYVCENR